MSKLIILLIVAIPFLGIAQNNSDTLSLQNAISTSLKNNYGIVISNLSVEQAKIKNSWEGAGAMPTVSLNLNSSKSFDGVQEQQRFSNSGSMNLNWILFRGFSARITKKQLEQLQSLSQGNLNILVENTLIATIQSYYQVLLANLNLEFAKSSMQLSEDRYNQARLKKNMGTSSSYEVLLAKNTFLNDKSNYLTQQANFKIAVRQLNFLMATNLDNTYVFTGKFESPTQNFNALDLVKRVVENNNTLKTQYINLELAKLDVKQAKSSYYPVISTNLSESYADNNVTFDNSLISDASSSGFSTNIGAGLTFNIYQSGQRRQTLKIAKIKEQIAQIQTTQKEQEIKKELLQELDLYNVRLELYKVAEENVKTTKLNFELTQEKYKVGAINSFNFRDVQQMYINSVLRFNQSIFNVITSYNTLLRLTGGIVDKYGK